MKNNKLFKRLITLCLLVIVAVMFIPGVFAAFDNNSTGSITVNGLEKNVVAKAYRLIRANISNEQPQDPVYIWEDSVATWMLGKDEYKGYVGEGNAVDESFNKDLDRSAALAKFYDDVADAIRKGDISGLTTYTSPAAGEDGKTTIADVKMGNYIVLMNNGMRVYKPLSANVIPKSKTDGTWEVDGESGKVLNSDITAKSSAPGVVKKVEDQDGNLVDDVATGYIGKKVKYTLDITVPHYPDNAINKKLLLTDQLSNGLDLFEKSEGVYDITVVSDTGDDLVEGTHYSFDYTDRLLTFHFDGDGTEAGKNIFYDKVKGYNKITVTYYATINGNAIEKAENTATLHYSNDPYSTSEKTPTDKVTVYTYGFDVTKIKKGEPSTVLTGAEFIISKNEDASEPLLFVAVPGKTGEYRLAKDGEAGADSKLVATEGTLKVYGLDTGTYYVKETKAPAGYVINPVPQKKKLTDAEPDGVLDDENEDDNLLTFNFENSDSIIDLPVTGGIGTLIFSIIGVLFMGTSIVLVRNILKKKEVQL